MKVDKPTIAKLRKFAKVFAEARERNANESDTVMYLIKFFEEVFEYDPLAGEITKEVPVNERYCDFCVRLEEKTHFLVEAKSAGTKQLSAKNIEQAETYASHSGVNWVLLTNGVVWQLYHLKFGEKVENELMFDVNFVDDLEQKPDWVWNSLSVLCKRNARDDSLDSFYDQQKLLNPKSMVNLLLSEEVLMKLRQELNRKAPNRLELTTVFEAVRDILSQEALAIAADIEAPARKKHHHKHQVGESTATEDSPKFGLERPGAEAVRGSEAPQSLTNLEAAES
jgi:Type I restriction enzyme R protein N terminus (HSDR_N)